MATEQRPDGSEGKSHIKIKEIQGEGKTNKQKKPAKNRVSKTVVG